MSDLKTRNTKELVFVGRDSLSTDKRAIKTLKSCSKNVKGRFYELIGDNRIKTIGGLLKIYEDQNRFYLSIINSEPLLEFYHEVTRKSPYLDFYKNSPVQSFYDSLLDLNKDKTLNPEQQTKWSTIKDVYKRIGQFYDYLESLFRNKKAFGTL